MRGLVLLILLALSAAAGASASPWQGFSALALSRDGTEFATGGRQGEVLLWETATGEILGRWTAAALPVAGLEFSADGTALGVVTLDGACSAVVFAQGTLAAADAAAWKTLPGAAARALAHAPALEGVVAAAKASAARGGPDGTITVTPASGPPVTWHAQDAAVTALAFSPDGSILISCGYDGTLACWDPLTGRPLGRL